jgi:hypothetical protein
MVAGIVPNFAMDVSYMYFFLSAFSQSNEIPTDSNSIFSFEKWSIQFCIGHREFGDCIIKVSYRYFFLVSFNECNFLVAHKSINRDLELLIYSIELDEA